MGEVNYYLKAPNASGKSAIYLRFKYHGQTFKYYFGESIDPASWSDKRQRVKNNRQTTKGGQHSLNELLDSMAEVLLSTYRKELKNGVPDRTKLKQALDQFYYQNFTGDNKPTLFSLIDKFIKGEIRHEGQGKAYSTLQKYKTVKGHLLAFQSKYKYPIDFDSITLDFFYKFVAFLEKEKQLQPNTIAKDIQVLKTFMNEAVDLGYTTNLSHRHRKFTARWVEVDSVYLSDKELMKLYKHDFSANKRLEQVRDLFIFGCYTGLRFSDYSTVQPENIISIEGEPFLKIVTKKTGQLVIIPCNPIVLDLFTKYASNANKLPKSLSIQKFNDYIKEGCRAAKLTEKGRLIDAPDLELWECVSSHTARRSFATNLYLDGFPTLEIMKLTGHRTEKAFLKYIKVSRLDTARRLQAHIQKNWSEKILRIA